MMNEKMKSNLWGNKTRNELNKYVENSNYSTKTRTGIIAPFNDIKRN